MAREPKDPMARYRKATDEQAIDLADDLAMLATQIREAGRGEGALPNPWSIDDWLVRYRQYLSTLCGSGI